jgi:tetratricopeptide (TPR) repeat protein
MIKYYSALIYFYINKDFASSVSNIIFCLEKNPTMAEFWCLLGDINFELKKYKKAFYFYENAIILGKLRVNDDELPVDIIKYKDYPEKMKINCKEYLDKV